MELTQLFMMNKNTNKNKYLKVRVSEDELDRLKNLSSNYHSMSAFILDACWHFQGEKHLRKLEIIEEDYLIIENEILKKKVKENKDFLSDLKYYSDNGKITIFVKNK